jgi:hypothetical protein
LKIIAIEGAFGHRYKYLDRQKKSIDVLRELRYVHVESSGYMNRTKKAYINLETMMVDDQLNEVVQSTRQRVKDIKEERRLAELERWENVLYLMDKYRIVDNTHMGTIYPKLEKKDIDIWYNVSLMQESRATIYYKLKQLSL